MPNPKNIPINPSPNPKVQLSPSGDTNTKRMARFRTVFPDSPIGSEEGDDIMNPAAQRIDTVASYREEVRDPSLHGADASLRSGGANVAFNGYDAYTGPRTAPFPRAAQDEGYLGSYGAMNADPLMTDQDSDQIFLKRDIGRKDLYGRNRAGVLHNDNQTDPTEQEQAQLSQRRGQAAADPSMPQSEKKQYIAEQGQSEASKTRLGYNVMSRKTAQRGY